MCQTSRLAAATISLQPSQLRIAAKPFYRATCDSRRLAYGIQHPQGSSPAAQLRRPAFQCLISHEACRVSQQSQCCATDVIQARIPESQFQA